MGRLPVKKYEWLVFTLFLELVVVHYSGTYPLGHLFSRDTSIQKKQNFVLKNIKYRHYPFCICC